MPVPAGLPQNPIDYIQILKDQCNRAGYKAAVCDMLGRKYQNDRGKMVTVTEDHHPYFRYEVRSKQHVAVYGFNVIYTNYGETDEVAT